MEDTGFEDLLQKDKPITIHITTEEFKGIVRSLHQKNGKIFFCDCNLSSIKLYISVATS